MLLPETREESYITQLKAFLGSVYGLDVQRVEKAPRGFYGETWTIHTPAARYFMKIVFFPSHQARYASSFSVLDFLAARGIDCISRAIPTVEGALYARFQNGVAGVFAFVEGEHTKDYPLEELFRLLARMYAVDTAGLDIPRDICSTHWAQRCEENLARLQRIDDPSVATACRLFARQEANLEHYARRLAHFVVLNEGKTDHFYITTGDVGGNVIVRDGTLTLIDWDHPLLSPVERDVWPYLNDPAQLDLFNHVMAQAGLDYTLRRERLAYYCYSMYFFYLHEYMQSLLVYEDAETRKLVLPFLEHCFDEASWVKVNLRVVEAY